MSDLGHYDNHPAYRYQALFVSKAFKFGRDRTNCPNIEAEIGRSGPWFTGFTGPGLLDDGTSPIVAIFEPLTDDVFGAGLAESDLHYDSFNAMANAFYANGLKISVNQSEQTDLRSYLAAILEYFDGFLVRRENQIAIGYWKTGNIDPAVLPLIGSDDLTAEPRLKSTGFDDCYTEVNVAYHDRQHYYHDAVASLRNPALQQLLGEYRPITVQRPFIIDARQANAYATQYLQRYARPGYSGEIDVKLERVEAIEDAADMPIVGQLIKVDIASIEEEIVLRVIECEYPADEGPFTCTLTVELERTIWPELFIQPPPDQIGDFVVNIPAIVNFAPWELPSGLKTKSGIQLAWLAQRPAKSIIGFRAWSSTDNIIYDDPAVPSTFCAYGQLTAAYPISRPPIDTTLGALVKLFGVDKVPTQSIAQRDNLNWLMFFPPPAPFPEILAVGQVISMGAGVYKIFTRSGLGLGTPQHSHGTGEPCYFIQRSELQAMAERNKVFIPGDTVYFKLQTFDHRQEFPLADFPAFAYTFHGGPVDTPGSLTLTTSYVITSERTVDSRIDAAWLYASGQDVIGFRARCRKFPLDVSWVTVTVGLDPHAHFRGLEPNVEYEVQVMAFSALDDSDWSDGVRIVTAAPNVPGVPTNFSVTAAVMSNTLNWTNALSPGIRGTQILFSEVSPSDGFQTLIDEVKVDKRSYVSAIPIDIVNPTSQVFYSVRHVNTLGVIGARTASIATHPLVETPATKLPTPFIARSDLEVGTRGSNDYRLQVVNTSAGQVADLEFSYNKTAWTLYSETGNYRSGVAGSVLPTSSVGEVSLSAGGQLFARLKQDGFLTSDVASFFNNTSNTPHSDGTGGNTGGQGKIQP